MAVYLAIDEKTSIKIQAAYPIEGEEASLTEDVYLKLDELTEYAKKIAAKVKSGLDSLAPSEYSLELGFAGGSHWFVTAEGSIKLTITWKK